jgi:hypothetical protein
MVERPQIEGVMARKVRVDFSRVNIVRDACDALMAGDTSVLPVLAIWYQRDSKKKALIREYFNRGPGRPRAEQWTFRERAQVKLDQFVEQAKKESPRKYLQLGAERCSEYYKQQGVELTSKQLLGDRRRGEKKRGPKPP